MFSEIHSIGGRVYTRFCTLRYTYSLSLFLTNFFFIQWIVLEKLYLRKIINKREVICSIG